MSDREDCKPSINICQMMIECDGEREREMKLLVVSSLKNKPVMNLLMQFVENGWLSALHLVGT